MTKKPQGSPPSEAPFVSSSDENRIESSMSGLTLIMLFDVE